jgi:hypothetical protein
MKQIRPSQYHCVVEDEQGNEVCLILEHNNTYIIWTSPPITPDDRHLLRHLPLPATLRPHFIITSENTPTILVGLVLLIPIFHF